MMCEETILFRLYPVSLPAEMFAKLLNVCDDIARNQKLDTFVRSTFDGGYEVWTRPVKP